MIDYFNITIEGDDFPEIGKKLSTMHPSGAESKSFTEVNVRVASGAPKFIAKVETNQKRMRFSGSPAAWLQGHNGMGSNDFRQLVKTSVLLVFETLDLECPASVLDAISSGEYNVHEVHVTEQYSMPRELISVLCENIRRHGDAQLQAVPIPKGIGVRLWPNSRDREVLIYDKFEYFMDGLAKHKKMLLGGMPMGFARYGTSHEFGRMMEEVLALGIRIEARCGRLLNKKSNLLNKGSYWLPETARDLHRSVVDDIPLSDLPPIREEEQLLATATTEHKILIALWLTGRNMRQFFNSDATFFRKRKQILEKYTGIDLSIQPMPGCGIRWVDVINPSSIIEVPEWAKESGFVFFPEQWRGWENPTQNHRSWLRPEPQYYIRKERDTVSRKMELLA